MKKVDGIQGHSCDMIPANPETGLDALRKLKRLLEWTDYFGLETRLPRIIEWVEANYEHPEDAKTLVFLSGHQIEQRKEQGEEIDAYYCYEEPYTYTEETRPKSMTTLGMPEFPSEDTWWDRSSVNV